MREKLIELLEESLRYAGDVCGETGDCSKCKYDKCGSNCGYAIRADYLIANGVTIAKWIPVTERLPERYQNVLTVREDRQIRFDAIGSLDVWYEERWHTGNPVTHWMPLPEPPKENDREHSTP